LRSADGKDGMAGTSFCSVCGNEIDAVLVSCPFCGAARKPEYNRDAAVQFRVVNLEKGMPLVRDALQLLAREFETASRSGCRALVLIHGYGSSGRGGAIKDAVHEKLRFWLERKKINEMLPGENGGRRSAQARQIAKRFPFLEEFVQRPNPGITVVII